MRDYPGELNTAFLKTVGDSPYLVLVFDQLDSVEEVIITHEIGHWVLKLQGFLTFKRNPSDLEEGVINGVAHHPALYQLQRTIGQEPQTEIDSRAELNRSRFSEGRVDRLQENELKHSFEVADDLLSCSPDKRQPLHDVRNRYRRIARNVAKILEVAEKFNPSDLTQQPKFLGAVKESLNLGPMWSVINELDFLRQFARKEVVLRD